MLTVLMSCSRSQSCKKFRVEELLYSIIDQSDRLEKSCDNFKPLRWVDFRVELQLYTENLSSDWLLQLWSL